MTERFKLSASRVLLVLFLLAGSVAGNRFKLPMFYDVDFLFGSICTMLLLVWFPFPFGLASALLAGGYTYVLWNHPYACLVIVGEALFVRGVLFRRSDNLVLIDALYWTLIGMPLVYLFYHFQMGVAPAASLLIMFKQGVNGIFNALIASLISLAFVRLPGVRRDPIGRGATYRNLLFLVLTSLVLFPTLISTVLSSRYDYAESKQEIARIASRTSAGMKEVFSSWMLENFQTVEALGRHAADQRDLAAPDCRRLLGELRRSNPSFLRLGLCDDRAVSVAVDPPRDEEGHPTVGVDYSDREVVRRLRASGTPQVSEILVSRIDRKTPLIVMTYPLAPGATWRGYAFGSVDLNEVSARMGQIIRHWNADLTVLDNRDRVVFSTADGLASGSDYYEARKDVIKEDGTGLLLITQKVGSNVSVMQRWKKSTYAKVTPLAAPAGWSTVVEVPVEPFLQRLFRANLQHLATMMGLVLLTVLLAQLLSQRMVSSIVRLQRVTTRLPDRIHQGRAVEWPESSISEVRVLVDNFQAMSRSLSDRFQELRIANEELTRAKEAAESASRAKSDFLAVMSHEIRTPMNAILGTTEIALEEEMTPEERERVETIRDAGLVLLGIINNVLDFAKIESGRLELETVDFDLSDLMGTVARTMEGECRRKGLTLDFEMDRDVPAVLRGDPVRLQQILVNLIGNAVKFTERGGVTVTVRPAGTDDAGGGETAKRSAPVPLVFAVEDTGPGIPEDKFDAIFESFHQADSSTSRKYGGSGLGLAICRRLAEAMGGRLTVDSRLGHGSRFSARVVLAAGDPDALPAPRRERPRACAEDDGAAILLAEDNLVNAKVALAALARQGHRVTHVGSGEEVLRALAAESFDLVLMDLEMPGLDGLDTTRRIRDGVAGEGCRGVPVVAMTAHALSGYREKCLAAGMNDYVSKPVRFRELRETIRRVLGGRPTPVPRPERGDATPRAPQGPIDWPTAMERVEGDEGLLKSLCAAFVEDLADKLERVAGALAERDFDAVVRLGHTVKGAAGTISALPCAALAEELERAGRDADGDRAEEILREMRRGRDALLAVFAPSEEKGEGGAPPGSARGSGGGEAPPSPGGTGSG